MEQITIIVGQVLSYISKACNIGAGATWPGEIALRINPHILSSLIQRIFQGVILVAGTNGKTTTSLMIKKILEDKGYTVLHNASGANLLNGIVSAFFSDRRSSFDYAVFEVDENALSAVSHQIASRRSGLSASRQKLYFVLLNLFRDQLDRYGEVDTIAEQWQKTLSSLDNNVTMIINADDPHLAYIGKKIKSHSCEGRNPSIDSKNVFYFGLDNTTYYLKAMQHATDTIYCPSCGSRLTFEGVYFSHLGKWNCTECRFTHPTMTMTEKDVTSPLSGVYNIYNTLAATLLTKTIGIGKTEIKKSLEGFTPAFGRMEKISYQGKNIRILLSKNPTGFNESLRTALSSKEKGPLLLLLNDRIPDGTDVSWIWDVDFEQLRGYSYPLIISGDRALDMGVRLKYGITNKELRITNEKICIEKNLEKAVEVFTNKINDGETGWILATYSAMLDVRKILTGRSIL